MKETQLKAIEQMQKKIENSNPTNAKYIIWNTFGRNNWRKVHGFPLMRGEVEKLGRKIHRKYRGYSKCQ